MKDYCEYNPVMKVPSLNTSRIDDCKNEADFILGKGKFRLCAKCAEMPEFSRFKKTEIKREK